MLYFSLAVDVASLPSSSILPAPFLLALYSLFPLASKSTPFPTSSSRTLQPHTRTLLSSLSHPSPTCLLPPLIRTHPIWLTTPARPLCAPRLVLAPLLLRFASLCIVPFWRTHRSPRLQVRARLIESSPEHDAVRDQDHVTSTKAARRWCVSSNLRRRSSPRSFDPPNVDLLLYPI